MYRNIILLILLLTVCIPAVSAGEGAVEEAAAGASVQNASRIPLTRVTLYTAGLAQMVHETTVNGHEVLSLYVDPGDINDLLKSMTLEDLDGGTVDVVSFDSADPLSVTLGDLRMNPAGSPGLAEFIKRSQGESVRVLHDGAFKAGGRIFSVETFTLDDVPMIRLNLLDSTGLRPVLLAEGDSLLYEDPSLQKELDKALTLISDGRRKSVRRVDISFTGTGSRRVRISYIRAVPLWKTSYRGVADDAGKVRLEGWALVQNTGVLAWDNVRLSFVAGSPNAFTMDLATPKYVSRRNVEVAADTPLAPAEYAKGYAPPAAAPMRSMAAESSRMDDMLYEMNEESYAPAPVESRAGGIRQGNFYRYEVSGAVSVAARSSAMIPILMDENAGSTLGIYDPDYAAVFKGIRLVNSSDAHWPAGPVTVLEGRSYGGDALLPDMIPGSRRIVNYALHGSLEVDRQQTEEPRRITALKISGGVLQRSDRIVRETMYTVSGSEGELILIHPKQSGWKLTRHPEISEETDSSYRFSLKNWQQPVRVGEEYIVSRSYALLNLKDEDVKFYLEWENLSLSMKGALDRLTLLRRRVNAAQIQVNTVSSSLASIERDQNRVRENMRVLDKESSLFRQYSEKLAAQEEDINRLSREAETRQRELTAAGAALTDYVNGLDVE